MSVHLPRTQIQGRVRNQDTSSPTGNLKKKNIFKIEISCTVTTEPFHNLKLWNILWIPSARYTITHSVIAKIDFGVPDKMSGRPSVLCRTFWAPVRHFSQLMAGKFSGHSYFPYRIFYVDWTLLDKMSDKVWALCRTSAEVCRTCPACLAYFAITAHYLTKTHEKVNNLIA